MENENNRNSGGGMKFNFFWIYGVIAICFLALTFVFAMGGSKETKKTPKDLVAMLVDGAVEKIVVVNEKKAEITVKPEKLGEPAYKDAAKPGWSNKGFHYWMEVGPGFTEMVRDVQAENNIPRDAWVYPINETRQDLLKDFIRVMLPIIILILVMLFIMRRITGGGGGSGTQIFNIGKSKATLFDEKSKVNLTFADVAGLDEAKEEVIEIVDFLKTPKKYTALGGKIPKGVLLVGAPGTGKTLLAKAVAGEAGVPFFSISGSDFVEMFVGVGASRVRDLFRQAREKAPCIVFIDEIDAVGRARGRANFQGSNDERENTLNQLLVEMDGFSTDKGVILMAATNRPDVLDTALMRPGRFDRVISIDLPDLNGREAIFGVHLKNIKKAPGVDAAALSEMTPGFAGAEIANVCNEAALIAARRSKKAVDMDDFNSALDRVIAGLEKKNKLISPSEKEVIAYHEAGHAVCGWFLEHASPLVKVTIVPRNDKLGFAQYLPKEEYITRTEQLLDRICMAYGGRAAETIVFGKVSTGAQNDLDQVTKMAYAMVTIYGMNEKVGQVSFHSLSQDAFQRPFSDETASMIDEEVRRLLDRQFDRAKQLLAEHREDLEKLAQALLETEVLHKSDVERLVGRRPYPIEGGNPHFERLAPSNGEV
ncbi:MAG: ATP-dependent zinc metalloprotease FtsH [Lewinellaceae bacterium]|nr:ATP-dependent zinc metalloprotease FtsH [Lewinella sp.]MCB9280749.1 ATP-dependent zinc metalloprotease FtsH [Lewinellaceae bacterium]